VHGGQKLGVRRVPALCYRMLGAAMVIGMDLVGHWSPEERCCCCVHTSCAQPISCGAARGSRTRSRLSRTVI